MEDDKGRRRRPELWLGILLALAFLLFPLSAAAQKAKRGRAKTAVSPVATTAETTPPAQAVTDEIQILAKYWERTKDHYLASGKVEVHYKSIVLFADSIDLQTETKDVRADGHVVLQSPNEVTTAESMTFNLDTALGRMEEAVGLAQPNIFFEAGVLDRVQPDYYRFTKATFTTCTQPNPRWRFSCTKANYKKDDYMEMWGMVLSIKGIPVFYFPYLRYPIQDRSTGLLRPSVGYTKIKGYKYSQDFYLVLGRNMDATLNLSYYSSVGLGASLEYRYLFSGGTGGLIRLSEFFFKRNADGTKPDNAYIVRVSHNQKLPLGFNLVADVDLQSSYDFLREFDNNFSRATVSNRRSQVYLSNSFSGFNFSAQASRFETNFATLNNSIITQYLPQVSLSSFKMKVLQPLYFSFNSSFSRWEYGWRTDYDNGTQKHVQSLNFSPTLSLPLKYIPWATVTASLSGNLNYYWQSYVPGTANPNVKVIADQPFFSRNLSFVLDFRGPTFFRVFRNAANDPSVKHIIEPFITYRYDTPTLNSDRIVTATGYFFRYHTVTYGISNHLLVKDDRMSREMLTLEISQTKYLDPDNGPLSIYTFAGRVPTTSDILATLRFFPSSRLSLDVASGYNTYHNLVSSVRAGARLGNINDNFYFNVNWFKSLNPWRDYVYLNRQQINLSGGIKIPALNLEAQGEYNYNIYKNQLLYAALSFVYHYQCIDFDGEVRVYNYRQQPDVQYSLSIGLGKISKSADFLGGLEF
jgi:LPS-assembly protein